MADDNIFLNSDPVMDDQLYPREADGVLRTTVEEFDLKNWNDTPVCDETKDCSCGKCQCSHCTDSVQEDSAQEDSTQENSTEDEEETEFVDP